MAYRPSGLFRARNILGAALAAGIALGIYLGQFKGLGTGGDGFFGLTRQNQNTGDSPKSAGEEVQSIKSKDDAARDDKMASVSPAHEMTAPKVVRILIDDRQFLLREGKKDSPIALPKLIALVKDAPGDDEGIRVRIYQTLNARVSAEEQLKDALSAAEIPDTAVFWVPSSSAK